MTKILTVPIILFNVLFCTAQEVFIAPPDKAVIYFVRGHLGGPINQFSFFDSSRYIGSFSGAKYFRYECKPGYHLFWAIAENKDFVEAEVAPGKVYFLEARMRMGIIRGAVELIVVDPKDNKAFNKLFKNKKPSAPFTEEELEGETANYEEVIEKALGMYWKDKAKGYKYAQLKKTMYYTK